MSTTTEQKPRNLINVRATTAGIVYELPKREAGKISNAFDLLTAIHDVLPPDMATLAYEAATKIDDLQRALKAGKVETKDAAQ